MTRKRPVPPGVQVERVSTLSLQVTVTSLYTAERSFIAVSQVERKKQQAVVEKDKELHDMEREYEEEKVSHCLNSFLIRFHKFLLYIHYIQQSHY